MIPISTMMYQFHIKYGFPIGVQLREQDQRASMSLESVGNLLLSLSKRLLENEFLNADVRMQRAQLMVEELGELIKGMGLNDELEAFDGAIDLAYTAVGTCTAFGWPFEQGFTRVHNSNMSKLVGGHKPVKGADFVAPNLGDLL